MVVKVLIEHRIFVLRSMREWPTARYTLAQKAQFLRLLDQGIKPKKVATRTLRRWKKDRDKIFEVAAALTTTKGAKNMPGAGRPEAIPFMGELLTFIASVRADNKCLSILHLVEWIRHKQPAWLTSYLENRKNPLRAGRALHQLCFDAVRHHEYTYRRATKAKFTAAELEKHKQQFASYFWSKYFGHPPQDIINIDETAVYFDSPPRGT